MIFSYNIVSYFYIHFPQWLQISFSIVHVCHKTHNTQTVKQKNLWKNLKNQINIKLYTRALHTYYNVLNYKIWNIN